jgi:hypothetical protein
MLDGKACKAHFPDDPAYDFASRLEAPRMPNSAQFSHVRGRMQALTVGLAFKLVLGPALILAFFGALLGDTSPVLRVTVFEAAMGAPLLCSI